MNGGKEDLAYLKGARQSVDATTGFAVSPPRNPNFLNTSARGAPLSVRRGMTVSF